MTNFELERDERSTHTVLAEVLVIGGGPAGMSAALWCTELGLRSVTLERHPELGGQLLWIHNPIKNYLGLDTKNGVELRDLFVRSIDGRRGVQVINEEIVKVDLVTRTARAASKNSYSAEAIVIATGVRRRSLGIPGEARFRGRGLLESGASAGGTVRGKTVVIVGGGDAAVENALILAENASSVHVIHRRAKFAARSEFVDGVTHHPRVHLHTDSNLIRISGDDQVRSAVIENRGSGFQTSIDTDFVLIRIGVEPNSELFRNQLGLDAAGYISVDGTGRTTLPGIFAVGDVANPTAPTISTATGTAAAAAKAALDWIKHKK